MKKTKTYDKIIFACALTALLSCKSTKEAASAQVSVVEVQEESQEETVLEIKDEIVPEKEEEVVLKITSTPSRTTKNVPFASPYKVKVEDMHGNSVPGFSVTASYPISRKNDAISYMAKELTSDGHGEITFTPDTPSFSFDDKITFQPTSKKDSAGVSAPFLVRTNYAKESAIVYIFDFDEQGNAQMNSLAMLRELINSGVKAGNSPISSSAYISRSVESLYNATAPIVGTKGFLISGSVKFLEPVSKQDEVFECNLEASVTCIDMGTGKVLYTTKRTARASDSTKQKAIQNCKNSLAKETIRAVLYSM